MKTRCITPFLNMTEDELLHGRLRAAVSEDRVVLLVDCSRLNLPGSPAHSGLDALIALMVPVSGLVATIWFFGWVFGLVSLIAWAFVFFIAGRIVLDRVNVRACRLALTSDAHLDELWRFGGLSLRTADGAVSVRPGGSWRDFARQVC